MPNALGYYLALGAKVEFNPGRGFKDLNGVEFDL
jgi:hypothetical protein